MRYSSSFHRNINLIKEYSSGKKGKKNALNSDRGVDLHQVPIKHLTACRWQRRVNEGQTGDNSASVRGGRTCKGSSTGVWGEGGVRDEGVGGVRG